MSIGDVLECFATPMPRAGAYLRRRGGNPGRAQPHDDGNAYIRATQSASSRTLSYRAYILETDRRRETDGGPRAAGLVLLSHRGLPCCACEVQAAEHTLRAKPWPEISSKP